ncbi:MAG: SAM hydrolase/SAM-dependent halogenase family protein [Gammaproteobacteria bacterium]
MILLVTDFGLNGPYVGQILSVLQQCAAGVPAINLFADAPTYNPKATAYLLAAYAEAFPEGSTFLAVVDPEVGTGKHVPVIIHACERWFVGPDNGLFNVVCLRAKRSVRCWEIFWRPERVSASFHGRDLYAPVAARVAQGDLSAGKPLARREYTEWPPDLWEIVYIDHFGNAVTGIRASEVDPNAMLEIRGNFLRKAYTFGSVSKGDSFWYENSAGLIEIAANCDRADLKLGLSIGDHVAKTKETPGCYSGDGAPSRWD